MHYLGLFKPLQKCKHHKQLMDCGKSWQFREIAIKSDNDPREVTIPKPETFQGFLFQHLSLDNFSCEDFALVLVRYAIMSQNHFTLIYLIIYVS